MRCYLSKTERPQRMIVCEHLKMENSLNATNARRSATIALSWTTIVIGYATHSCLVDRLLAATAE